MKMLAFLWNVSDGSNDAVAAGLSDEQRSARLRRMRRSAMLRGAALGIGGFFLVGAIALVLLNRDPTPKLTRADFEQARQRWQQHWLKNYDVEVTIAGNQPGSVQLEVRGGEIIKMTRDGVTPRRRETWRYWSIEGQLETIDEELDMAADPAKSYHAPPNSQVLLTAAFDPELGYPQVFHRVVLGAAFEVRWETRLTKR